LMPDQCEHIDRVQIVNFFLVGPEIVEPTA
jgi:hypothetical protein